MKSLDYAFLSKRECSVQDGVYHIPLGQQLRKTLPGVVFANSNILEKRFRMCLSEREISELREDYTRVLKRNMVDRYIDRRDSVFRTKKFTVLNSFYFAEILR